MTRTIATAMRAVRDRVAKLPRSQRWIAGGVAGAILVAGAVATAASASPTTPTAQPTAVRVDQRANRSEVRTPVTPSIAPSTLAPTPSKPVAPKPVAPKPVAPMTTRATPQATAAKPKPLAVPTSCSGYSGVQRTACALLPTFGFATSEMAALIPMWDRESGWSYTAANPSGAYGIPQALPGSKMAVYGSDWRTNPATQIKWGLSYIKSRYGSPSAAWSFWQAHGWY